MEDDKSKYEKASEACNKAKEKFDQSGKKGHPRDYLQEAWDEVRGVRVPRDKK